jgi:ribosome-associated heat shock protein Hsp15
VRLDKLLWYLRLARTRSIAQDMVEAGHIRLNGRRVERSHTRIGVGDVLVLPLASGVRVIEIVSLPARRGPAPEAMSCYRPLDEARNIPIAAAGMNNHAAEEDLQP